MGSLFRHKCSVCYGAWGRGILLRTFFESFILMECQQQWLISRHLRLTKVFKHFASPCCLFPVEWYTSIVYFICITATAQLQIRIYQIYIDHKSAIENVVVFQGQCTSFRIRPVTISKRSVRKCLYHDTCQTVICNILLHVNWIHRNWDRIPPVVAIINTVWNYKKIPFYK